MYIKAFIIIASFGIYSLIQPVESRNDELDNDAINQFPIKSKNITIPANDEIKDLQLLRNIRSLNHSFPEIGLGEDQSYGDQSQRLKDMKDIFTTIINIRKELKFAEIHVNFTVLTAELCDLFKEIYPAQLNLLYFKYVNVDSANQPTEPKDEKMIILHDTSLSCEKDKMNNDPIICCSGIDECGKYWTVCENTTVHRHCNPKSANLSMPCDQIENPPNDIKCNCRFLISEISILENEVAYGTEEATNKLLKLKNMVEGKENAIDCKDNLLNLKGNEIEKIAEIASNVPRLSSTTSTTYEESRTLTRKSIEIITDLLVTQERIDRLPMDMRTRVFTNILSHLDSMSLPPNGENETEEMLSNGILVVLGSKSTNAGNDTTIFFSDQPLNGGSYISVTISPDTLQNSNITVNSEIGYVGAAIPSEFVQNTLKDNITSSGEDGMRIIGVVISLTVNGNHSLQFKGENVKVVFKHDTVVLGDSKQVFRRQLKQGEKRGTFSSCSFWDSKNLKWSTKGCRKISLESPSYVTTCVCNHLTAFATLAGYHDYVGKDGILQIMTWILCPISLLCLFTTLIIFLVLHYKKTNRRSTMKEQEAMTIHLCGTLICGNLILLASDKDNFHIPDTVCISFGVLAHYTWLCAFGWMACQGIQLHFKIIKVFNTPTDLQKYYALGSYGMPLIVVGLTSAVGLSLGDKSIYVGEMFCWLTGNYIWFFMGPVLIVLVWNLVILIWSLHRIRERGKQEMVRKSRRGASKKMNSVLKTNRKLIKGVAALSMLLGMTWFIGFFSLVNFPRNMYLPHIFTALNASQGIFIFLFHCCMNETIRPDLLKLYEQCLRNGSTTASSGQETTNNITNATSTTIKSSKSGSSTYGVSENQKKNNSDRENQRRNSFVFEKCNFYASPPENENRKYSDRVSLNNLWDNETHSAQASSSSDSNISKEWEDIFDNGIGNIKMTITDEGRSINSSLIVRTTSGELLGESELANTKDQVDEIYCAANDGESCDNGNPVSIFNEPRTIGNENIRESFEGSTVAEMRKKFKKITNK